MENTMEFNSTRNQQQQGHEGPVAKVIEQRTKKLPSDLFLWAAVGSITASLAFQVRGDKFTSLFVGQWAPTFLILGLYNKIVKVAGSDSYREQSDGSAREAA